MGNAIVQNRRILMISTRVIVIVFSRVSYKCHEKAGTNKKGEAAVEDSGRHRLTATQP